MSVIIENINGLHFPAIQTQPFNVSDFSALGTVTWTVTVGEVQQEQFALFGKMLWIWLRVIGGVVGGTADNSLTYQLPNGLVSNVTISWPIPVRPNGANVEIGQASATAGSALIALGRVGGLTFPLGATNINCQICLFVQ